MLRNFIAVSAAFLLCACGGGGGGGGNSTSISVDPSSLSFSHVEGDDTSEYQTVNVDFRGDGVIVGFPPDETETGWVYAGEEAYGSDSARFSVSVDPTLPVGTHTTTLRFVTGRVSDSGNVSGIKYKDVEVTVEVVPNDLSISAVPGSLSFETYAGGSDEPQFVDVTFNGLSFYIESAPSWLNVQPLDDGSIGESPSRVVVALANGSSANPGTFTGVVRFATSRPGNSTIRRVDVPVSYTVRPAITASGTADASQFVFGGSATTANGTLTVTAPGQTWTAQSSAPWLQVSDAQHTGNASLPLAVDVAGLAIGSYNATITVANFNDPTETRQVYFAVTVVAPTLSTSVNSLLIGGSDGLDSSNAALGFSINTGTNAWPWTLTFDAGTWGSLDLQSGTVSNTGQGVAVNADRNAVAGGTYTGSAALSVNVNGHVLSKNIAVTFKKEAERYYVSQDGIALAKLASRQELSRDITVTSTLNRSGTWTAESDQAWLSVTPSGATGEVLSVTADPNGLAANQTHIATVTVTPDSASIENAPEIRVGLWIGDDPPARIQIPLQISRISTSPVEPLAFAYAQGSDLISAYNVYTGELVRSFASGASQPGALRISSDGLKLFLVDRSTSEVRVLDSVTGALLQQHAFSNTGYQGIAELAYARPGALPALLIGNGTMIDLVNGTVKAGPGSGYYEAGHIRVSPDSRAAYVVNDGSSPSTLIRYSISRTALGSGLGATATGSVQPGSNGEDLALSPDGKWLYTADGAPYQFNVFNATTLASAGSLAGQPYPNNAEMSWKGVFVGGTSSYYDPVDLFFYDAVGTSLGTDRCSGTDYNWLLRDSVQFSGDGLRLTCATEGFNNQDWLLNFLDVPAN